MALLGSTGGGDTLALAGANEFVLDNLPATGGAGYELTSAGKERSGVGSAGSIIYTNTGDWVIPNGSASLYEVRATLNSGAVTTGTTGSFLSLGTTRTWTVTRTTAGISAANLTIDIRRIGGATILATATVALEVELV